MNTKLIIEYNYINHLSDSAFNFKELPGYFTIFVNISMGINRNIHHTRYIGSGNIKDARNLISEFMTILPRYKDTLEESKEYTLEKLIMQELSKIDANYEDVLFEVKTLGESRDIIKSSSTLVLKNSYKSLSMNYYLPKTHIETFVDTANLNEKEVSLPLNWSYVSTLTDFILKGLVFKDFKEVQEGNIGKNPFELFQDKLSK